MSFRENDSPCIRPWVNHKLDTGGEVVRPSLIGAPPRVIQAGCYFGVVFNDVTSTTPKATQKAAQKAQKATPQLSQLSSRTSQRSAPGATQDMTKDANEMTETISGNTTPPAFSEAVESMHRATLRPEITLGTIRPPQRLAPFSHAIGLEVEQDDEVIATDSEGDAFGRLILLHDPGAEEAWTGSMRLVAYIQADMDHEVAADPLLPDVAWEWLTEGLAQAGADHTNLGGTVTATASVRFGEIGGPPRSHQLEMRASWTAEGIDLAPHVAAFSRVLANVAGLPPEGVTQLGR